MPIILDNPLTKEQRAALNTNSHISLSANAGSGKTFVLTQRYLNIILGCKVSEADFKTLEFDYRVTSKDVEQNIKRIAAITFTKKAANEMRERIVQKVEEWLVQARKEQNTSIINKLRVVRERIVDAKIMTIHSFCLRILQEYVIEAKLEPNFKEIDDIDKHYIYQKALQKTLREVEENDIDVSIAQEVRDLLFSQYTTNEINNFLMKLLHKRDIFYELKEVVDLQFDEYVLHITEGLNKIYKKDINAFVNMLQRASKSINDVKWNEKGDDKNKAIELQDNILKSYNSQFIQCMQDIKDFSVIKNNGNLFYYKQLFKAAGIEKNDYESINTFKDIDVSELLHNPTPTSAPLLYNQWQLNKFLFQILELAQKNIDEEKRKINGIDFDDMMWKVVELFNEYPEIPQKIAEQYDEIMVDEFQDTNNTQLKLITSLIPSLTNNTLANKMRLFIVGDAKQSIYRFREADVSVFNESKKMIYNANKVNKNIPGNLELTTTFRNLPVITSFVNCACGAMFEKYNKEAPIDDSRIEYSDLVCGRKVDSIEQIATNSANAELYGSVKFLLSVKEENNNEKEVDENDMDSSEEALLLAQHIKTYANNNYKDIAILYRSRNKINKLTHELRRHNIPFEILKGKGFFSKQEVKELICFLKFLCNSNDALSLVGIMTSSFYGFNTNDLLNIFYNENKKEEQTYWKVIDEFVNKETENSALKERVIRMQNELNSLLQIASNTTITHLLRCILSLNTWFSQRVLLKNKEVKINPKQQNIVENIEKFISIARQYNNRLLADFIEEIEIISQAESEGEASIPTQNAVSLVTIHSAKGLEFNTVYLYNLNSSTQHTDTLHINKKYGIAYKVPKTQTAFIKGKNIASAVVQCMENQYETAETLRMLYVALTRSKNNLFLSACLNKTKNGYSKQKELLSLITQALNLNIEQALEESSNPTQPVELNLKLMNNEKPITFSYSIGFITSTSLAALSSDELKDKANTKYEISKIQTLPAPIYQESEKRFSFSGINSILRATVPLQKKYVAIDTFNIPDEFKQKLKLVPRKNGEKDEQQMNLTLTQGANRGSIFHKVFEQIKEWYLYDIDEKKLQKLIQHHTTLIDKTQNADIIYTEICNVIETPLMKKYSKSISSIQTEKHYFIPLENGCYYNGIIDGLVQNTDGEWEIWDWKTNNIVVQKEREEKKEYYSLQMKLYIYILMYLYPNQQKFRARLLFTRLAKPGISDDEWCETFEYSIKQKEALQKELQIATESTLLTIDTLLR